MNRDYQNPNFTPIPPVEKTQTELLQDRLMNVNTLIENLVKLGYERQLSSDLANSFSIDQINILNAFWNDIERYITKHFNLKFITPYFLKNYFLNYINDVDNKANGVFQSEPTIKENKIKSMAIPNDLANNILNYQNQLIEKFNNMNRETLIKNAESILNKRTSYFKDKTIKEIRNEIIKKLEDYEIQNYDYETKEQNLNNMEKEDNINQDDINIIAKNIGFLPLKDLKKYAEEEFGIYNFYNSQNKPMTKEEIKRKILDVYEGLIPSDAYLDEYNSHRENLDMQSEDIKPLTYSDIKKMNISKLKSYAKNLGIASNKYTKKEELLKKIINVFEGITKSEEVKQNMANVLQEIPNLSLERKFKKEKENFLSEIKDIDKNSLIDIAKYKYNVSSSKVKKNSSIEKIKEAILDKIKRNLENEMTGSGLKYNMIGKPIIGKPIKFGKGLQSDNNLLVNKPPKLKSFGYYNINYPRLDKNIFNILYKSGSNHHNFQPIKISNEYKDFLKELVDNCKIDEDKFKKLNKEECIHFNNVFHGCGLNKKFKLDNPSIETIKQENNRFNILIGELQAGNNNKEIIKELKNLIKKFMNDGRLDKQQAQNALNEILISQM
jgi:hypothetical protein